MVDIVNFYGIKMLLIIIDARERTVVQTPLHVWAMVLHIIVHATRRYTKTARDT